MVTRWRYTHAVKSNSFSNLGHFFLDFLKQKQNNKTKHRLVQVGLESQLGAVGLKEVVKKKNPKTCPL